MPVRTLPTFVEAEWRNDSPALAALARKLVLGAQIANDADRLYTPADPKVVTPGSPWTETPKHSVTAGGAAQVVAVFPVPDSVVPSPVLELRAYVALGAAGNTGTLRYTVGSTGAITDVALSTAAFPASKLPGGGTLVNTSGWITTRLHLPPGADTVSVTLIPGAGTATLLGLCGDMVSTCAVPAGQPAVWQPLSFSQTNAYASVMLRTLARNATLYSTGRRQPVVAKWFDAWRATAAGSPTLGAYQVHVSPGVRWLQVWALVKWTGTAGPDIGMRSSGAGARVLLINAPSQNTYTWVSAMMDLGAGASPARDLTLTIDGTVLAGQTISIASVSVWEIADGASVGAGYVPASFPALQVPMSRDAIRSTLLPAIYDAWAYVSAKRTRQLVCDCRHTGVGFNDANSNLTFDPLYDDLSQGNYAHLFREVIGRRKVNWTQDVARSRVLLGVGLVDASVSNTHQYLAPMGPFAGGFNGRPPTPDTQQTAPRWVSVGGRINGGWDEEWVLLAQAGRMPVTPWEKPLTYDLGAVYTEQLA